MDAGAAWFKSAPVVSRILGVPPALRPVWGLGSSAAVFQVRVDGAEGDKSARPNRREGVPREDCC